MRSDELARYCEAMLYDYEPEWTPDGLVEINRADVLAWKRPGWSVGHSRVVYAKWSAPDVDKRVDELLAFFGDTPFNWHVGPSSSPRDLVNRLMTRGLRLVAEPRMMTITLPLPDDWPVNREVRIVEVADAEMARLGLRLAHHDSPEIERDVVERMAYLGLPSRRGGFLVAYIGDVPCANAGYRYSSDGRCVYLTGAETVEQFRGQGVYKTLIAHRAAQGVDRGCVFASILANVQTSGPILARRGFADHGPLPRLAPPESPRFGLQAVP
jgi:GNAT superfamily N-acetyltransferase